MIKILFVDHTPFVGGAQLVLAEHIAALDKTEFDVHVACTNDIPELVKKFKNAGAQVHIVPMPRLRGFRLGIIGGLWQSIASIRGVVAEHQIDLVVTNTTRASYVATVAVMRQRVKLIWWVRDFLYPKLLFRFLGWRTAKIFYVSKAVRDWYGQAKNPKSAVLYVASNLFIPLNDVDRQHIDAERARYGFKPTDFVVGFMGRMVMEKGAQDAVEAVARLQPSYPRLKLLLVGTGRGQMHTIEPQLHDHINQLGLAAAIKMAGYQTNEALYYSLFDAFVLPTRDHEPYATSVVQAMMAGKPVIGTNAGGTPELIQNNKTGLLYQPGDVEGLARAMKDLLDNPQLAENLAQAGKRHVLEFNREDQLARQAETLYRQVLS